MSRQNKNNYSRPNIWGMIRDVMIASLNKGQFLLGIVGLIIIILVAKLPSKDVSTLFFGIIELFKSSHFLGWTLSCVFLLVGILIQRKSENIMLPK